MSSSASHDTCVDKIMLNLKIRFPLFFWAPSSRLARIDVMSAVAHVGSVLSASTAIQRDASSIGLDAHTVCCCSMPPTSVSNSMV